ncbi:MAG TPA: response regulator [Vitreimonas sp.]|uniref:response regulator n=1 Tax=Vitreimonas sp. TaxID=3069702 RepID=UPI002D70F3C2|nr:response regulator [Vitreimonas sp.]HYD88961.1 response regulator [Vitreimonas sp.]
MTRSAPSILLVEDDLASAEALTLILRDWGADVTHADSAEAIDAMASDRLAGFRYIITDFHLGPGVSGVAIAERLAAQCPGLRVLVLSGSFHAKAAVAAQAAGYEIMQKPARAEAILAWLERT